MRKKMSKNDKKTMTGTYFMLGNHAVVEGALAAGCDFFAGYPITPANEISQYMSQRIPKTGGVFFQGEDELCSIFALSGASLSGAKAMTATASAGFNYMQEGIGYAVASEIPMVIGDICFHQWHHLLVSINAVEKYHCTRYRLNMAIAVLN
jgi:2-oxoglutarate ferredoxin oxidoreductase subunit alpha